MINIHMLLEAQTMSRRQCKKLVNSGFLCGGTCKSGTEGICLPMHIVLWLWLFFAR